MKQVGLVLLGIFLFSVLGGLIGAICDMAIGGHPHVPVPIFMLLGVPISAIVGLIFCLLTFKKSFYKKALITITVLDVLLGIAIAICIVFGYWSWSYGTDNSSLSC